MTTKRIYGRSAARSRIAISLVCDATGSIAASRWRQRGAVVLEGARLVFGRQHVAWAAAANQEGVTAILAAPGWDLTGVDEPVDHMGLHYEAISAAMLSRSGASLKDIASVLGLASRAEAQRRVALGNRPAYLLERIDGIHAGHLRHLTALPDRDFAHWIARVASETFTTQQLKNAMRQVNKDTLSADLAHYTDELGRRYGTEARMHWSADPSRRWVELAWFGVEDLRGILERLANVDAAVPVAAGSARQWIRIALRSADDLDAVFGPAIQPG